MKFFERTVFAAAIFSMLGFLAAPAEAQSRKINYGVYASGFSVVNSTFDIETRGDRYHMLLQANTIGFLDSIVPWKGSFETSGWQKGIKAAFQPEHHKSTALFKGEEELKDYKFGKDGSFREYRVKDPDPENDGLPKKVDDALTQNTVDFMSAGMRVMERLPDTGKCEGEHEVFDGKRRYRLVFRHIKEVHLKRSALNIYEGPAVECEVETQPVAGEWHKKPRGWMSIQEQSRKNGMLPTIWMGQFEKGGPVVPVKIRVKTDYGTLFMHATGYEGGGIKLALEE